MDKIKPSCEALFRRRRSSSSVHDHEAQNLPAGEQHELDDILNVEQSAPTLEAEMEAEDVADEDTESDFKYSVYEEPRDEVAYEIGKMIARSTKLWQVRILANPGE